MSRATDVFAHPRSCVVRTPQGGREGGGAAIARTGMHDCQAI